jgi:hypothetical protein
MTGAANVNPFRHDRRKRGGAATSHNVTNTGTAIREYVWIVAPVSGGQKQ